MLIPLLTYLIINEMPNFISCYLSISELLTGPLSYANSKSIEKDKVEDNFNNTLGSKIMLRDDATTEKCPCYDYDVNICKFYNNRILCGYNKNKGNTKNSKEIIETKNGCRIRGDRMECGYIKHNDLSTVPAHKALHLSSPHLSPSVATEIATVFNISTETPSTVTSSTPSTITTSTTSTTTTSTTTAKPKPTRSQPKKPITMIIDKITECRMDGNRVECGYIKKRNTKKPTTSYFIGKLTTALKKKLIRKRASTKVKSIISILTTPQLTNTKLPNSTKIIISQLTTTEITTPKITGFSSSTITSTTASTTISTTSESTTERTTMKQIVASPYFSSTSSTKEKSSKDYLNKNKVCKKHGNRVDCGYEENSKENEVL